MQADGRDLYPSVWSEPVASVWAAAFYIALARSCLCTLYVDITLSHQRTHLFLFVYYHSVRITRKIILRNAFLGDVTSL